MYVRVTSRCQMNCSHCAYDCGEKGQDMPLSLFEEVALEHVRAGDQYLCLGGGEPTLHPDLFAMFEYLEKLADDLEIGYGLVTNGADREKALALLDWMDEHPRFSVRLSQAGYHDEIDSDIVACYARRCRLNGLSPLGPVKSGRCSWGRDGCLGGPMIEPDGSITLCGCYPRVVTCKLGEVDLCDIPSDMYGFECSKKLLAWGLSEQQPPLDLVDWMSGQSFEDL